MFYCAVATNLISTFYRRMAWLLHNLRTFAESPPLPDPVRDVADKVEEEVAVRNRDNLVLHLDEETEPLG